MWKDTSRYLGELLIWEIEDYLCAQASRPDRARVAFIRLAGRGEAEAVAADLEAGGSFYAAAKRAQSLGMTLPGEMFGVVTREECPEVFEAVPGTTFPPVPEGDGFLILRLVAFES
ncbi:hypothetical protein [Microbispora sp. ATCC PTA-5024]|uniref:hypothetical protein n=1 Tax=Microbispora sp. ATCC PTA-5024 TaxID=316330 RepID=UPI0003DDD446|nr:hypothetical protein [Microbispora sp. ATCC PTA-5024]ETK32184.1 hypothetical protein MPTA5024_31155 [Microbispora sp. ATCC PTA-5024]